MNLIDRDKKLIWHPFTRQQIEISDIIAISRAKNSYIFDENGKKYLDLISSWWVNLHGHANPRIAKAIYNQARSLEHIIFAGFTHEPAVKLCENLKTILPQNYTKFFFSDNGSTTIEVALKLAYQYWHNRGEKKRSIFLSFEGGYHGDTFGAMSVGNKSGFHDVFDDLFFKVISLPYPHTYLNDAQIEEKENIAFKFLDDILSESGEQIAAIILEPLIQGASGMRFARSSFIEKVINKVRAYDILVIFDEVMTGFGRLGTNFAFEQTNIEPDFLCISKGITGGFLPLALTVTSEKIYSEFISKEWNKAFMHGHSYTANPIACAAANESLNILTSPACQSSIKDINIVHQNFAQNTNSPFIKNIRFLGTICAFEVYNITKSIKQIKDDLLKEGLIIRPLGNSFYILPPYCTTRYQLENAYKKLLKVIK